MCIMLMLYGGTPPMQISGQKPLKRSMKAKAISSQENSLMTSWGIIMSDHPLLAPSHATYHNFVLILTDMPAFCFASELFAAFPKTNITLTSRSPESWFDFTKSALWASQIDPIRPSELFFASPQIKAIARCFDTIFDANFYGNFPRYGQRVFVEHNNRVRAAPPKDRFWNSIQRMGGVRCVISLGRMLQIQSSRGSMTRRLGGRCSKLDRSGGRWKVL